MGKKLFSLCMALVLCLSLLPATALAADNDTVYVGGVELTGTATAPAYATTNTSGDVITEGASADKYNIKWDGSTLTLKDAYITNAAHEDNYRHPVEGAAIGVANSSGAAELTIELESDNTIEDVSLGIWVYSSTTGYASLTIRGNGSLTASVSANSGILVQSNDGNATLSIENAEVTTTSSSSDGVLVRAKDGSNASLTVNGGSLTATGSGATFTGIKMQFGSTDSSTGTPTVTVSGNAIVRANGSAGGITSNSSTEVCTAAGTGGSGGIVWNGKNGTVYGDVTLDESLTINQGETLTIPDGASLTIDSGATLTNEGTVTNNGTLTNNGTINNSGTLPDNIQGAAPPSITTTSLAGGIVGEAYNATLAADGEPTSWTWSADANSSLPPGLTLSGNSISGTPTTTGTYYFTVTASNNSGSDSKPLSITISSATNIPVQSVSLDKTSLELTEGGTGTLIATVAPTDATNKAVTWSSDDTSVATVDADGKVTAVGAGEATITVTTEDGGKTATCAVTVEKPYTPPPYIPPTKTPSQQAIDKIEDAKEGSTVKITLRTGQTKLDKEVFEELAGRDVTLEISLPGGVTWTVNGEDIPKTADLTDLDMGVSLNTSTIPVDLINAITGEIGTVQLTLKHDGPFGFTMTLTAPVGKENEGLWANLYHYDEDAGEMVYQTAALVDEDGNAALPFDHASQYALVLDSKSHDLPFTDLAADAWYTDAVAYVYRHDIMEGMSATTFQPNGTLSRAMAVQIFYNLEGQPDISGENLGYPYEDVNAQAWYGDAVYWARITGVATGYGDGTFQPGDSITRQEFAQMLYNYAKYKGYDLTAEGDLSTFPDAGSIADWAKVAMSWANGNELINGHDDGTIDAAGTAIRAQAASILMRFDQTIQTE